MLLKSGGKTTNKTSILTCYSVIAENEYKIEDNRFNSDDEFGVGANKNRINSDDYVDLFMLDDNGKWVNLETHQFIPNKTGYYSMKIVVYDDIESATIRNSLTVNLSFYVDKRIVLIQPFANNYEKEYEHVEETLKVLDAQLVNIEEDILESYTIIGHYRFILKNK